MEAKEFYSSQERKKIDADIKALDEFNLINHIQSDEASERGKRYIVRVLIAKCEKLEKINKIMEG